MPHDRNEGKQKLKLSKKRKQSKKLKLNANRGKFINFSEIGGIYKFSGN